VESGNEEKAERRNRADALFVTRSQIEAAIEAAQPFTLRMADGREIGETLRS
jgi:hypothetical protein